MTTNLCIIKLKKNKKGGKLISKKREKRRDSEIKEIPEQIFVK